MSAPSKPTCEQKRFALHPRAAFVEACPGAGKTRAILDRLENLLKGLPPRHCIGVLSFTQSAVEEFVIRCKNRGLYGVLSHPHFCGTFDAFVRHFLVVPTGIEGSAGTIRPTIVDSWESMGIRVQVKGVSGQGPFLDSFDPETNSVDLDKIGDRRVRAAVAKAKDKFEDRAKRFREGLRKKGYLSAADARLEALRKIQGDGIGPAVGRAVAARFIEIIVDEGQDCNPQDIEILRWLRQHGVRVTLLADLDQSIYEFRQGKPETLNQLAAEYSETDRLPFTGNFRSSPAICTLASTLRGKEKSKPDQPLGAAARVKTPIKILSYDGKVPTEAIGKRFAEILVGLEIPLEKSIVLAHKWRTARCAARANYTEKEFGASRVAAVARAVSTYRDPSAKPKQRLQALQKVEQLILALSGELEEDEPLMHGIECRHIDQRILRRRAAALISSLRPTIGPSDSERSAWVQELRTLVVGLGIDVQQGNSVKKFFAAPNKGEWSEMLCVHESAALSASSIHEAKGQEYRAVCVAIPREGERTEQLIKAWESQTALEAKRVVYVGITRAKELVVIAIPRTYTDRITAILRAAGVPYDPPELLAGSTKKKPTRKRAPKAPRDEKQSLLFEDM